MLFQQELSRGMLLWRKSINNLLHVLLQAHWSWLTHLLERSDYGWSVYVIDNDNGNLLVFKIIFDDDHCELGLINLSNCCNVLSPWLTWWVILYFAYYIMVIILIMQLCFCLLFNFGFFTSLVFLPVFL